jgi:glycosyltransferase involved in cell wall biosynthesis
MTAASITTIVPFFNREHTILHALESVKAQTLRPQQLIVVDDGSTDGGPDLVNQWIAQNRDSLNCRLHRQPKSMAAAAAGRNAGLLLAEPSDFVAFLDSDDIWPANFLERTHGLLAALPQAVAASCDRRFTYADGQPDELRDSSTLPVNPTLWILKHGAGLASATLFRRSHVDQLGGFPLIAAGEDAALFLPLSLEGAWLYAPGEPTIFSRGLAERLGDAKNLSDTFNDCRSSWAQIYDDFLVHGRGRAFINDPNYRRLVARMWYVAGRQLLKNSAPHEAVRCFRKSLAWNPWQRKCYMRMLRAFLKTLSFHAPLSPSLG